jgi:polysaccharide deacetylase family protein (PEP-CTERM system associated)
VRNIFTVDLEEWFHVCGVAALARDRWDRLPSRVEETTDRVLDLLDACSVPATFVVVGWVAERHPALIQRVVAAGHQIGSHGYAHERVYDLGPERFADDLESSVAALRAVGVGRVQAYRAPEWSINERSLWALDTLAAGRFSIDASMAPLRLVGDPAYPRHVHMRATAAGALLEVPPLVADRCGHVMPMGWGWGLRMSSPRRVLNAIAAENRQERPAVLTLHPWELDPDPPRVPLPLRLRFAHYFCLHGFEQRLREVLTGAAFGPLDELRPYEAA